MRLLHFSDIHIGVETYGRPVTQDDLAALPAWFATGEDREKVYLGHSSRLVDFLCAFDELVHFALESGVDLVLFTGDAYKSRDPTQTHQREFAKRVGRLASSGVPVFLLVGNHDLPHVAHKASAVEIFGVLDVPRVTIAERLVTYRVETPAGPLQVLALPWVRRSTFLARDEVRNLPFDKVRQLIEEKLVEALHAEAGRLDPDLPAVLAAHVSLNTAKLGTERTMMIGQDHVLMQSQITALPVDYIALGHIHRRQELSTKPPAIYPGSLQRVDFGEEDHEAKGFYVIDIDPSAPLGERVSSTEFRPVQARPFATVSVTLRKDEPDPTGAVVQAVRRQDIAGAIVRVQVKLPAALSPGLNEREVRKALDEGGAHHVAAFSKDVERENRTRLGAITTEGRSPVDLLKIYLTSKETPKDRAEKLTAYAQRLMAAEEGEED